MMNSSVSSPVSHLQQYHHTHIQQQQISHSQYAQMHPQPTMTMMTPGATLPPPYTGSIQGAQAGGPPLHISMHQPVVSQQNCQMTLPTNSIVPPNAATPMTMHMAPNRPASMGGFSQHPGAANVAMMAAKTQNPHAKFVAGPGGMHTTTGFPNSPQPTGQMVSGQNMAGGNMSYGMQQQMVFNNNNTVPYSAAGMTQRQVHPSQMIPANSINAGVQSLPNKHAHMMMQQEQQVVNQPVNLMPVNSTSVAQLRNGTTVMSTPQNPSYVNMQGQLVNQTPPQSQQQSVNVFPVGGPGIMKTNIAAGAQHQMGMMIQQQQGQQPGMSHGGVMSQVPANGMPPSQIALNRQRFLAMQQQQQMSMQKSHMMRQAVTPPASIEAATHMGGSSSVAFQFNQQGNNGQNSMARVSSRIMDTGGGMVNNCNSKQIPSPASNNSQMTLTASTAMIGAPHSVPASQEVMPPSPQVTNNPNTINQFQQPPMFTNNQQSLGTSFAKRQSTTPPVANPRATPSPISRKNSSSAALKRRSSSTSSFDQGSEITGANSNSANDLNEPTKICRLTPVNGPPNSGTQQPITSSSYPQTYSKTPSSSSFNSFRNNSSIDTSRNNIVSSSHSTNTTTNNSISSSCHYNTTLTLDAVHRKDSLCSLSTDTHSSPDSGLGDSGSESNGSSSTPLNSHIISTSPRCGPTPTDQQPIKGGGATTLSSEQMLENLIQELGIEQLDHLPELLDIFDNDSVFSNGTTSSCESNNSQQTRPRAAHVAAP